MRILILNDDSHENQYCFENGVRVNAIEALETLAPAHSVNYEYKILYLPDAQDLIESLGFYEGAEEIENLSIKLFDTVMWGEGIEYDKYLEAFDELWELAE